MGRAGKAFTKQMSNTRGEAIGMSLATGLAVGTTNNVINKNYVKRGRQAYYRRKLRNGKIVQVKKAVNHGVGLSQTRRK